MAPPRLGTLFRKGVLFECILIGIIIAEVVLFLWLFIHPALFQKAPVVPAGAPQVIASNPDQPAGGGLALPGQPAQSDAPPASGASGAPAAAPKEDDTGHQAAAKGEDLHLYLTIDNAGAAAKLTGASSADASVASLQQAGLAGAAASPAGGIPIAANGVTTLDDESAWIVLAGLNKEFKKGERIDVTLEFDGADPVTLSVPIYRTRETAAENPEPALEAGALSIGAYWARPFDKGA